ncbi:hypothetical protein KC349_g8457 [Hortaea werneckii]|nr:hypothetical protein KC349_g8457 [Hortaea werneckii]
MSEGQSASNEALRKLLDTGEYSDLTIKCGLRTFKVHKAIVCARSEYFAAACKPDAFKEGATGSIELQSTADPNAAKDDPSLDDPAAVKLMIDFLYLHDYPLVRTYLDASDPLKLFVKSGDDGAIMHAKVYALGSKYQIPSLQSASLKKFEEAANLAWDTDEFVHAVHLVHSTTPDSDKGLRNITASVILEHDDELCNKPAMEAVRAQRVWRAATCGSRRVKTIPVDAASSAAIATTKTKTVATIAKNVFNAKQVVRRQMPAD